MRQAPLLERDHEVTVLQDAAKVAQAGRGRVVVVEGEAGVGKTSLLGHVRNLRQASEFRVLSARGSDLETQFAFGIVRQLFEPSLVGTDDGGAKRLLSGAARGAIPVFAGEGGAAIDADLAVLHGLYWLTVNLCAQPTLLLIDDLHWSDAASLRYLAYLAPRVEDLGLLVVVAVRNGERAVDEMLLQRILTAGGATVLRPAPLSEPATAALLGGLIGRPVDPSFAAACFQATAGNPLLLQALADTIVRDRIEPTAGNRRWITEIGPRAVAHHVSVRLSQVSPEARAIARAVAVLGQDARPRAVAELSEVDLMTVEEGVLALERSGLFVVERTSSSQGMRVSYAHRLLGAAVYQEMSAAERARAHRRAVDALVRLRAPAEQIGAHLLRTPPGADPDVVRVLQRAAVAAESRGSAEAALAFLERCLDEGIEGDKRLGLLEEAGRVALQVDLHTAVRLLEEARELAQDSYAVSRIAARLGAAYGYLVDPDHACQAFSEALEHVPAGEEDLRRRLEATLLLGAFVAPGRLEVRRRLPELTALPVHDSLGGRMLEAAIAEHEMGECDPAGKERARAAISDGTMVREVNGEGALVCGWLTLLAADDEAAIQSLDAAVEQAHLYGSTRALAAAYCFRSLGRLWRGQLSEAEHEATEALRMAQTGRVDMDPTFAGAYLADTLIEQGRLDVAAATLASVGVPGKASPGPRYSALDSYARLLRHRGQHEASIRAAAEAGQVWAAYGLDNPALGSWRSEASLALFALGRVDEAHAHAQAELNLASRWGAPRSLGRALRVRGQITAGPDGIALLRDSLATLEASPARLERTKSLLALGSALRRAGHRTEARQHLAQALDEADVCGAIPLRERAATELRTAGARPRRQRLTGVQALTPSELRVASAAASGASNREIAQSLFVTTKTIEVHLSSAFRKLGVSRRSELSRHLVPVRLDHPDA